MLRELSQLPTDQLLSERYERFRQIGPFTEADVTDSVPDNA